MLTAAVEACRSLEHFAVAVWAVRDAPLGAVAALCRSVDSTTNLVLPVPHSP
jgi:hypothetical protein